MTAFISSLLSLARGKCSNFRHSFDLQFPAVMHRVLDDHFIKAFKEIFIIGDVHGCYDELVKLLQDAGVMDDSSLKIYVGDLVNKGPKNHEVVELLMKNPSSMISVRGNHDEFVLKEYLSAQDPSYALSNSNLWIKDMPEEDMAYLNDLPYTISIPALNAVIVHAGLVPGVPLQANDPTKMVTMRNLVVEDYFSMRGIQATRHEYEGEPWASLWCGPSHVYFGHDAKRMLQKYPYATGLDTGCVYGKWLTGLFISGPRKGTFLKVNAMKIHRKTKGSPQDDSEAKK